MKCKFQLRTWILLLLVNGVILSAGFFLFLNMSLYSAKRTGIQQARGDMEIFSHSIKYIFEEAFLAGEGSLDFGKMVQTAAKKSGLFRITVVASDGKVLADSVAGDKVSALENHRGREEVEAALAGHDGVAIHQSTVEGYSGEIMYYACPLVCGDGHYALRLAMPVKKSFFFSANVASTIVLLALFILFLTLLGTFFVSSKIIKPLKKLEEAAGEYKKSNFSCRPKVTFPREMADLASSMAGMAETIEEDFSKLKRLDRIRKDFIANASHELKTPVTSIKGFSETLLDSEVGKDDSNKFLRIIIQQTDRLNAIIDDLLSLSRLEDESFEDRRVDCDLAELLKNLIEAFRPQAEKKNIALQFSGAGGIKRLDPELISQAIGNIVDNAIKYCPEGSEVFCLLEWEGKRTRIIIEDNGHGISEADRDRVFERFYRVDKGRSREMGGTGLGLAITKHIAEIHGGKITCTGRKDGKKGACFIVEL